jgi:hypothetical protein
MIPHLEHLSSSGAFPILIGSILMATSIRILWKNRERYGAVTLGRELRLVRPFALPRNVVGYAGILFLYILTTSTLHFLASSYLFLVGSFVFLRGASFVRSLIIGAAMLTGIYLLFQTVFKVILW